MSRVQHQHIRHCLEISIAFSLLITLSGCGTAIVNSREAGHLVASANSITFGSLSIGQTATKMLSLTNGSSTSVEITQIDLTGPSFSAAGSGQLPVTIAPGGTFSLSVQFSPTTAGTMASQLTITSNSSTSSTTTIALSGTGVTAVTAATLSSLSCSSESITGAGTDTCTVALSAAAPSEGLSVSLSSSNAAVTVPATVTIPGNTTSIAFAATVSSVTTSQTATLTATTGSVSNSFALQLNATVSTAIPALSLSATSLAFGDVTVNTSSTQSVTLTSTGTASVTVSAAKLTGTGFTVSELTFPVTLTSGQAATIEVQFEPVTTGTATGQLTISSNSSANSSTTIALSGTGTISTYAVNLSWDVPTSSTEPIAGYNIYRTMSGSSTYVLISPLINTTTSYVDNTVVSGGAYNYVTRSLDDSGVESLPSNIISVTIP